MSTRTDNNIATLLEPVQPVAEQFISELRENLPEGYTAEIISGFRTYEEQDALYEQGRTKPGNIVTNARGGYSNHQWGTAFDVGIFDNGKYLDDSPLYNLIGKICHQNGLEWGGDWKSIQDKPHVEVRPEWAKNLSESNMMAEMRRRHDAREDYWT